MYPLNWPTCPVCGDYALDGHITCGRAACKEEEQRVRWQHDMITAQEVEEVLAEIEKKQQDRRSNATICRQIWTLPYFGSDCCR